jgi:hypothetical protein
VAGSNRQEQGRCIGNTSKEHSPAGGAEDYRPEEMYSPGGVRMNSQLLEVLRNTMRLQEMDEVLTWG